MNFYITSVNNWMSEITNVLEFATKNDKLIVDTKEKLKYGKKIAKLAGFEGEIVLKNESTTKEVNNIGSIDKIKIYTGTETNAFMVFAFIVGIVAGWFIWA